MAKRSEIDVIVVWKLDRWGRSVQDITASLNELQELGVGFVSITEALDFTTAAGRAMAGLLSVFAEFERDLVKNGDWKMPGGMELGLPVRGRSLPRRKGLLVFLKGDFLKQKLNGRPGFQGEVWGGYFP